MKDVNFITIQDFDATQFDVSNSDRSNKIKLKRSDTSLGGYSLTGLPTESGDHKDWLVVHQGKLALSTPPWLQAGPDLGVTITEGSRAPRPYVSTGRDVYTQFMNIKVVASKDVSSCTVTVGGMYQDGVTIVGKPSVFPPQGAKVTATSGQQVLSITNLPAGKELLIQYRFKCTKPGGFTFTATATLGAGLGTDPNPSDNTATYTINISNKKTDLGPFTVTDVDTGEELLLSEFDINIAKNRLNVYSDGKSIKGRKLKITGDDKIEVYKIPPNSEMERERLAHHFTPYSPSTSLVFSPMAEAFLQRDGDFETTGKMLYSGNVPDNIKLTTDEYTFDERTGLLTFKTNAQDSTVRCATQMYAIKPVNVKHKLAILTVAQKTDAGPTGCTLSVREHDLPDEVEVVRGDSSDFVTWETMNSLLSSDKAKWIGGKPLPDLVLPINETDGPTLCPNIDFLDGYFSVEAMLIKVPPGEPYFSFTVFSNGCYEFTETTYRSTSHSGKQGIEITGAQTECRVTVEEAVSGAFVQVGPLRVVCEER